MVSPCNVFGRCIFLPPSPLPINSLAALLDLLRYSIKAILPSVSLGKSTLGLAYKSFPKTHLRGQFRTLAINAQASSKEGFILGEAAGASQVSATKDLHEEV